MQTANAVDASAHIRVAEPSDAPALLEIYAPYVAHTAVSFEYTVPGANEFAGRIARVLEAYPYLLLERGEEILGYAYAGRFQARAAYDWAVETTIYLRADARGQGFGRRLYSALEAALKLQNVLNLNACIATQAVDDETLTRASVHFHERMGYRMVGEFKACGYKFGRWYDMVWMEKHLGAHPADQPPLRRFPEIRDALRPD